MKVAVTGGTGFVGAALLRKLRKEGYDVVALSRAPRKLEGVDGVKIVHGDLSDDDALTRLTSGVDGVLHLAGLTHARRASDFFAINRDGAARVAAAATRAGARFVNASSLSAREPRLSPYAGSKEAGERAAAAAFGDGPMATLRLPAIYGPGDRAALPFFKMVGRGLAPEPATRPPARVSLLYVDDAASALCAALAVDDRRPLEVGDDTADGRLWFEIAKELGGVLGVSPRRLRLPRALIAAYWSSARRAAALLGRTPAMREGQAREFFHPDWVARAPLLAAVSGWRAAIPLREGLARTVDWYRAQGLL